jgi:hypothetical protein
MGDTEDVAFGVLEICEPADPGIGIFGSATVAPRVRPRARVSSTFVTPMVQT